MAKLTIKNILAFEVLDSRGNPTVAAEVLLSDNSSSLAYVPSGASTGKHEALELRDQDKSRFLGKGVLKAVNFINNELKELVIGLDPLDQKAIDSNLCKADGTDSKKTFGANSILAISIANLRASATCKSVPLYQHIQSLYKEVSKDNRAPTLPVPMLNILNGGAHADNGIDFQEFMIQPLGFNTFKSALRCGVEIFHELKNLLKGKNFNTSVGDEGGFAPELTTAEEAIELILKAIKASGYKAGKDVFLCLDPASSEFFQKGNYFFQGEDKFLDTEEMISYFKALTSKYPIKSIEDGLHEEDWEGWKSLTKSLGSEVQLIGDDLFTTNSKRIIRGIEEKAANSVLVKMNQIGTISETMEAVSMSQENGYKAVISHRSGETEDTCITDLAIGLSAGQIKTGAPSRTDRVSKYNRLLILEQKFKIPFIKENEVV